MAIQQAGHHGIRHADLGLGLIQNVHPCVVSQNLPLIIGIFRGGDGLQCGISALQHLNGFDNLAKDVDDQLITQLLQGSTTGGAQCHRTGFHRDGSAGSDFLRFFGNSLTGQGIFQLIQSVLLVVRQQIEQLLLLVIGQAIQSGLEIFQCFGGHQLGIGVKIGIGIDDGGLALFIGDHGHGDDRLDGSDHGAILGMVVVQIAAFTALHHQKTGAGLFFSAELGFFYNFLIISRGQNSMRRLRFKLLVLTGRQDPLGQFLLGQRFPLERRLVTGGQNAIRGQNFVGNRLHGSDVSITGGQDTCMRNRHSGH